MQLLGTITGCTLEKRHGTSEKVIAQYVELDCGASLMLRDKNMMIPDFARKELGLRVKATLTEQSGMMILTGIEEM